MALKQLHLNDSAKTPIEPVISTESIPNKGVTNAKIADGAIDYRTLKADLGFKLTQNCVARQSSNNDTDKLIDDNKGEYISFTVEKKGLNASKTTLSVNTTNVTINGDEIALQKNVISVGQQAQQAMNDSRTAKQDAESALTKATTAESTANTASNNASSALTKANSASTDASSALSKANSALSTAGNASSLASEAKKSADSAGTKANELGAIVSALRTKVDKINTDLMVVVSDVSTAQATAEASASQAQSAYNLANDKQDKLVSGDNIKTINGVSLLGTGDVPVSSGGTKLFIHDIKQEGGSSLYLLSTSDEPYKGFTDLFSKGKLLGMLTSYGITGGTYFNDPRLGAMLAFLKFDFDTQTMVVEKSILMSKPIIDSNIKPL